MWGNFALIGALSGDLMEKYNCALRVITSQMYREGHIGTSLLLYLPLGYYLIYIGNESFSVLGLLVMFAVTMLPDIDHRIPMVPHRGITHSVWFAGALGYTVYWGLTEFFAAFPLPGTHPDLAFFLGVIAAFAIISHIIADSLTPMGIQPMTPFLRKRWTFNLVNSSDQLANRLLLISGVLSTVTVYVTATPNLS